jgi:hypothetical protein
MRPNKLGERLGRSVTSLAISLAAMRRTGRLAWIRARRRSAMCWDPLPSGELLGLGPSEEALGLSLGVELQKGDVMRPNGGLDSHQSH